VDAGSEPSRHVYSQQLDLYSWAVSGDVATAGLEHSADVHNGK
jgi:hypothetical protein